MIIIYMYILYKKPIQLETLNIVRYLHSHHINLLPDAVYERNYPNNVTELPSILVECITFYETY